MEKIKRILCVALSFCCLAALAGCGTDDTAHSDVPPAGQQEQTAGPDATPDTPDTGDAQEDSEMVRCDLCGGEFEAGNIFRNHICIGRFVEPYSIEISDDGALIYDSIGFSSTVIGAINEAGTYTIIGESMDRDKNPWGKLESGEGWICLTPSPRRPFNADYAPEDFAADFDFRAEESGHLTRIGIHANEDMRDFSICLLALDDGMSFVVEKELFSVTPFDADETILAEVVFYGDMTAYGISFTDKDGVERGYSLTVSGKDGSLVVTQYR